MRILELGRHGTAIDLRQVGMVSGVTPEGTYTVFLVGGYQYEVSTTKLSRVEFIEQWKHAHGL